MAWSTAAALLAMLAARPLYASNNSKRHVDHCSFQAWVCAPTAPQMQPPFNWQQYPATHFKVPMQAAEKVEQLTQALQAAHSSAAAEQEQLLQQLQATRQAADSTGAELLAAVSSGTALQAQVSQLQKQFAVQASHLSEARQQAASEKSSLSEQLFSAQGKAAGLSSQMIEAGSAADRRQAALAGQIEELQAAVHAGEAALAVCRADLAEVQGQHQAAAAAAADSSQGVARLDSQVAEKAQQLQAQAAELARTKTSLQVLSCICV